MAIPLVDESGDLVGSEDSDSTSIINEYLQAENTLQDADATGDEQTREQVDTVRKDAYTTIAETSDSGGSSTSEDGPIARYRAGEISMQRALELLGSDSSTDSSGGGNGSMLVLGLLGLVALAYLGRS